ncbi:hypothetical protein KSK37_13880 [Kaistella sp. DKR-2]|uniref:hypothetical protein n=1 Tax=Kaistella soli TaxID=2849654 RepID=UPI001C25AB23|nr:hypothetical protein [Kaistella soli]MBU8884174.1 hypothetical protein [Kaistella soli]
MKQILFLVILAFSTFLSAQTNDWKFVGKDEDQMSYYYKINANGTGSIKKYSTEKKIIAYVGGENKYLPGYYVETYKFDCANRKINLLLTFAYSDKDKMLEEITSTSKDDLLLKQGDADTIYGAFLKAFCTN